VTRDDWTEVLIAVVVLATAPLWFALRARFRAFRAALAAWEAGRE